MRSETFRDHAMIAIPCLKINHQTPTKDIDSLRCRIDQV